MLTTKVIPVKLLFNVKGKNDNISYWFNIYKSIFNEEETIPDIVTRLCTAKAEEIIKVLKRGRYKR